MIWGLPVVRFVTTVLLAGEFAGLVAFIAVYSRTHWRRTHAGRTIMAWPVAMVAVIALSFAVRLWPSTAMSWTLAASHAVFLLAVWHRVRVLRRYLRDEVRETPDVEGS